MKIENIIQTIKILKSDFKARYGVEPNACVAGTEVIGVIMHESNIESTKRNVDVETFCGMKVEVDFSTIDKIQVGYFSEACHLD